MRPRTPFAPLPLALLALLGAPAIATAGPSVYSFSDGAVTPSLDRIESDLRQRSAQACTVRRAAAAPPSFAAARTSAQALLRKQAGSTALARFAASADARSAPKATVAAAAAIAAGKPQAALATLLRAHQLRPRDGRPLISAAAVLTGLDRPREALAFLAEAQRLKPARVAALGAPPAALIASNRGHALLALGQWTAAEKALGTAAKRAPLLSEARMNLAHAQLCAGRVAAAARSFAAGARRQTPTAATIFRAEDEAGQPLAEQLAPAQWLDVSRGTDPVLPGFHWPRDEAEGKAMEEPLRARLSASRARDATLIERVTSLGQASSRAAAVLSPATQQRIAAMWHATARVDRHPDLRPLYDRYLAAQRALSGVQSQYGSGQAGVTCGAFGTWRAALLAYDDAARIWAHAAYRRLTAIAANAASPSLHGALSARAQQFASVTVSDLLQNGLWLAGYGRGCTVAEPPPADPGADTLGTPDGPSCPSGLTGKAFKIKLTPAVTLGFECEQASVELDSGNWLGAFAQATYNHRKGQTTVFAGPRFKVRTPGPLGPGATFKDGLYVTFGNDGSIRDVGARVETSVNFAADVAQASVKTDVMDFSIVGLSPLQTLTGGE